MTGATAIDLFAAMPAFVHVTGDGWDQRLLPRRPRSRWYVGESHLHVYRELDGRSRGVVLDDTGAEHWTGHAPDEGEAARLLAELVDSRLPDVRAKLLRRWPSEVAAPDAPGQLDLFGGGA